MKTDAKTLAAASTAPYFAVAGGNNAGAAKYVPSEGRIYFQLKTTAGAATTSFEGLTVTETIGATVYTTNYPGTIANVESDSDTGTSTYVYYVVYTPKGNGSGLTIDALTVVPQTWRITYTTTGLANGSTLSNQDTSVANGSAATFSFTVSKPTGASEWSLTADVDTNATIAYVDSNGGEGTMTDNTAKLGLTADSVTVTVTEDTTTNNAAVAVTLTTAGTGYALTTKTIDSSVYSTGNGIQNATWDSDNATTHNGQTASAKLSVNLGGVTTADTRIVVKYKVNNTEKVEKHPCTPSALLQNITLTADHATAGEVTFEIISIKFQVKTTITATDTTNFTGVNTEVNGTSLGVAANNIANNSFLDYGTMVTVTVKGTGANTTVEHWALTVNGGAVQSKDTNGTDTAQTLTYDPYPISDYSVNAITFVATTD